ncbi:MAG: O-antigen ligase family protein, partial [Candidatus Omnitrophica bacterium]|nr:O-antigen ligase family protein [Candidatus Omnitrophota bacterium]
VALSWCSAKAQPKFWLRAVHAFLIAGCLYLLFLTRSRGAILSFILGFMVVLLLHRKYVMIFVLLAAGTVSLFVLPQRMTIHLDADGREQSIVERYYLWHRAWDVIEARPWTGTGINTYAVSHQKYDQTKNWRVQNYYAHNGYLQLAAETGLPSLILFLAFLIQYFRGALKRSVPSSQDGDILRFGILAGILNFLIFAGIDTVLHNPQPVMTFWYLMGLQTAYQRITRISAG